MIVNTENSYGLEEQVSIPRRSADFSLTNTSTSNVNPIRPPIQKIPGALSSRKKRPERETDLSLPSHAEVKNAWSHISTPPCYLTFNLIPKNYKSLRSRK